MNRDDIVRILIEFFRDGFSEDPAGVGYWFSQGGNNIDAFIDEIDRWYPQEAGESR